MTMPEASVNKYRFPLAAKDKIRLARQILAMETIPKAMRVHEFSDNEFWTCIFGSDRCHHR